jgi:hypothetical protein
MLAGFFAPPDPAEQAKKWKTELIREQRTLDREIRGIESPGACVSSDTCAGIQMQEKKVTVEIRAAIKRSRVSRPSALTVRQTTLKRPRPWRRRLFGKRNDAGRTELNLSGLARRSSVFTTARLK